MKKLNLEQMEKIEGGKFWGSGTSQEREYDPNCPSGEAWVWYDEYYVFFIRTKHEEFNRVCIESPFN